MLGIGGALFLLGAGLLAGAAGADRLRERYRAAELICLMCRRIMIFLSSDLLTAEEMFSRLRESPEFEKLDLLFVPPEGSLSGSLAAASLETTLPLEDEPKRLLSGYFRDFGRTDLEGELARARLLLSQLEPFAKAAEEKYRRCARLYRMLGASAGAMAALVLC